MKNSFGSIKKKLISHNHIILLFLFFPFLSGNRRWRSPRIPMDELWWLGVGEHQAGPRKQSIARPHDRNSLTPRVILTVLPSCALKRETARYHFRSILSPTTTTARKKRKRGERGEGKEDTAAACWLPSLAKRSNEYVYRAARGN
jgi:hypothetical protein